MGTSALKEVKYEPKVLRLTELMKEVDVDRPRDATHYLEIVQQKIDYANEVRLRLGDEALAALAISAIRSYRAGEWKRREEEARLNGVELVRPDDTAAEETPLRIKPICLGNSKDQRKLHCCVASMADNLFWYQPTPRPTIVFDTYRIRNDDLVEGSSTRLSFTRKHMP